MWKTMFMCFSVATYLSSGAFAEVGANTEMVEVAANNCGVEGEQPYLLSGEKYTYSEKQVPLPVVAHNDSARTVAFSKKEVTFYFGGMDSASAYELRVQYLSDNKGRAQSLSVDGEVLQEAVQLPADEVKNLVIPIPPRLHKDGNILVSVKREKGDNAVVSRLDVYSSLSQPLIEPTPKVLVLELRDEDFTTPRYSPIPDLCGALSEPRISLNGTWRFIEQAPADILKPTALDDWKEIEVPGEWYMQGFEVEEETYAGYARTFDVPQAWQGQRIKLRFDAVYSDCRVYVNGIKAGAHIGGFTPFELDVTEAVRVGETNLITLEVKNESIADIMASGTKYACRPMGGITRKVSLFALPDLHLSGLTVLTTFDESFTDATLSISANIVNEGSSPSEPCELALSLQERGSHAEPVALDPSVIEIPSLQAGESRELSLEIPVSRPKKWDCENPNLYVLGCTLQSEEKTIETFRERFGFRQVAVEGNKLLVNGQPVKLRGINRHEAHPLLGRSLNAELWRQDAELLLAGNCNFIRASHYPPPEEFVQLCDEMGFFVEMEAPFCWEKSSSDIKHAPLTIQQTLEMVQYYKNNASVIFWSIANESSWGVNFAMSSEYVRMVDPTRPQIFSYGSLDLASLHYPGLEGAERVDTAEKPTLFDEYAHLNAYNRFETASDQGLRVQWSGYLSEMWEAMYHSRGCLGGAIWSGIDDTFFPPNGMILGYGTWGPIDGWRRLKPEWWGMKKVYSPVRVGNVQFSESKLRVEVENRQDFSRLGRLEIRWAFNGESGSASSDLAPHSKGTLSIPLKMSPPAFAELELEFVDPRGFMVDTFSLPVGEPVVEKTEPEKQESYTVKNDKGTIRIQSGNRRYVINEETGLFESMAVEGNEFAATGPHLMVLPLNRKGVRRMERTGQPIVYDAYTPTCRDWKTTSVKVARKEGAPTVTVRGTYREAEGSFTYRFHPDGTFSVDYDFAMLADVNPRQVGVVFDLPNTMETLNWKRKGLWTTYPDWHIGRQEGTARADEGVVVTCVGPRTEPEHPWRLDRTAIGSYDFSSTKHNIYKVSLTDDAGLGLQVLADADRHVRAWIEGSGKRLLVANVSNGGSEHFLRRLAQRDEHPLEAGDRVAGRSILEVVDGMEVTCHAVIH